ncbi:WRKY transcription factor 19 [Phytophthora cinnamomi]|uniref:WRKY transcription factor 19 n=1 Tax=Phytophthora cinnamomi TaxID=4785 RepID=UPI0035599760|nr:WRKY transcription factor 19 [Phytophthora cinnamomi]
MDIDHQHDVGELSFGEIVAMGGTTPPINPNKWGLPFILNAPAVPSEPSQKSPTQDERKRRRMCKVVGCTKYIVQMGRCCRHGGGKKCLVDGCFTGAKHRGLCWKHGGCTKCTTDGCNKKAKARGLCWSHGGGTRCQRPGCTKVTISKGFCWAHGGGKRCLVSDCIKPAFERTHNFCQMHYKQLPRQARAVVPPWTSRNRDRTLSMGLPSKYATSASPQPQ